MTAVSAGKLWGMRRLADINGRFKMLAVDQRPPIKNPIKAARGTSEAPYDDVAGFKRMLVESLQGEASAVLVDPHFALSDALTVLSPAKGMIVTLEDSVFQETPDGRLSSEIDDWSVAKIKRCGGDAVKVLAWYRPDAPAHVCRAQEDFAERIGEACRAFDIPFLFELLVYPLAGEAEQTRDYVEMASKQADNVLESVRRFSREDFCIDIFKLESPVPATTIHQVDAAETQALFDEMGRIAGRPWVMLSAGADMDAFERILQYAYAAGASGYLAGRAIWAEPFRAFPDWDAIRNGLNDGSRAYMRRINALTDDKATAWSRHPRFADGPEVEHAGAAFRHRYAGIGEA